MFAPLKTETIQAFLDEARFLDTKPIEAHRMAHWHCGTASCAVGDMAMQGVCGLTLASDIYSHGVTPVIDEDDGFSAVTKAFHITKKEAIFLFGVFESEYCGVAFDRVKELPQETAARLRKYLYYRLRKMEILANYESARRTGDIGVNIQPKYEDVNVSEREPLRVA